MILWVVKNNPGAGERARKRLSISSLISLKTISITTTGRFSTYYKIKILIKAIICSFIHLFIIYYVSGFCGLTGLSWVLSASGHSCNYRRKAAGAEVIRKFNRTGLPR